MWYPFIIRKEEAIAERMMHMMDWLKWKMIEWLVEHRVLAVVPVRANGRRRY